MKKSIFLITLFLLTFILLRPVLAQQGKTQNIISEETVITEKQIQQQENTQNQGEEQNLRIENSLQGETMEVVLEGDSVQEQTTSNRDDSLSRVKGQGLTMSEGAQIVKERNNDVANQVHKLLIERDFRGGIGEQVKTIAQNQLKVQEEVQNRLSNLENRPLWQRFFLGQNQDNVDGLQNSLRKNQEYLTELQSLLEDQALSAEDRLAVEEAYLELQAQQELVEVHLENILGEFSVVGFFKRLFNRS
jgi:hypothetical protein